MQPTIGFVLVTYNKPQHTLFLCERLGEMFGEPPIAIHHDFSQAKLDVRSFPRNVSFVEKWHRTRWGSMTVVDGQLAAIDLLYRAADPDWFVTLSNADYPIKTAHRILRELSASTVDGYFDIRQVRDPGSFQAAEPSAEFSFDDPRFLRNAFDRYMALPLMRRSLARKVGFPKEPWVLRASSIVTRVTPFDGGLKCYAGDFWFTARRKVAHVLLERTPLWQKLHRHFRMRHIPEEAFYHTLIGNTPGLQLANRNLRYTDWRGCYSHPRTLGREDFDRLLEVPDHFARKFPHEPALLRDLDEAVSAWDARLVTETDAYPNVSRTSY